MAYESLTHIYYTNPEKLEEEYMRRFDSPSTLHFDIGIKQYNRKKTYPAFMCFTNEMVNLIEEIFASQAALLKILPKIPIVLLQQYSLLCIVNEVKSSNDIEGVHSTRREIREALDNIGSKTRFESTINKYMMIVEHSDIPLETCNDIRKTYDDLVHAEVIKENPQNELDGVIFRKDSVDITSETGKTIHRGLLPEQAIIDAMDKALAILNNDSYSMLIRSALFHYMFAYIHPFYDGNGRTGRFIATYTLSKTLIRAISMRLSLTTKKQIKKYYKLFAEADSEINHGDLTPFVLGFLEIIKQAAADAYTLLQRKLTQFNNNIEILKSLSDDPTTIDIYTTLFQASILYGQGLPAEKIAAAIDKSKNTVLNRLKAIPQTHLVINTINRKKHYKLNLLILKEYSSR